MESKCTRLRYFSSKNPDDIVEIVNSLPHKIEIKGTPVYDGKKFYLFYIQPDNIKDLFIGDLDE